MEREDWLEMIRMVKEVGDSIPLSDGAADRTERMKMSHQMLQALHTTSAMLGVSELERIGIELDRFLTDHVNGAANSAEAASVFGFAVSTLLESMNRAEPGNEVSSLSVSEVLDILNMAQAEGDQPAAASEQEGILDEILDAPSHSDGARSIDFQRLSEIVSHLGGELIVASPNGNTSGSFSIHFQAVPAVVEQVETLLAPATSIDSLASRMPAKDSRMEKVLSTVKELMQALTASEVERAQDMLLLLSEQQSQPGLYKEIGTLARDLHNSLRSFVDSMDPQLREIVEDKIPDSGNRLEHVLELTEKAATTTLDQVELMQKRNGEEQRQLGRVVEILDALRPIGGQAQERIAESRSILETLESSANETRDSLITILTAQDYQDLTGQVVLKITTLLKDLEHKLLNVISTFGVRTEGKKTEATGELYGPAHKGVSNTLHSQDDVDSLLAEFGF